VNIEKFSEINVSELRAGNVTWSHTLHPSRAVCDKRKTEWLVSSAVVDELKKNTMKKKIGVLLL
jgi:hypothetical protein